MIPLELRKRRIERAVLTQFGSHLDDEALRELATGPTIQRLHLSAARPDGLDECTREMFSLAMLVRLGKVSEDDIRDTFAAFRRLDVNDEGVLNSRSIIVAMIQRRRDMMSGSKTPGATLQDDEQPPSPPQDQFPPEPTLNLSDHYSDDFGSPYWVNDADPDYGYTFGPPSDEMGGSNTHEMSSLLQHQSSGGMWSTQSALSDAMTGTSSGDDREFPGARTSRRQMYKESPF